MKKEKGLNIIFAGTAYPFRGGIASFNEMLARELQRIGHQVRILTFTVQYPSFLFPGKSQYTDGPKPEDLSISREINSVNPFNWFRKGNKIRRFCPDVLFLRYWSPYLAPCLGTLARLVRLNRHTRVIVLADNIIPHERHFYDKWLTSYFVGGADGFLIMSSEVATDLSKFTTNKPVLYAPHPVYHNYGSPVSREEACRCLGLKESCRYALFFGFIRKYKGLDLLLESWAVYCQAVPEDNTCLLVAGEYYVDKQPYLDLISRLGIENRVILYDRFIPDEEVKYYFCASDMVVQPYRSATQSGVTQIAYHFEIPMIVTRVGGLPEIVPDGKVGYVTSQYPNEIAQAIQKCFCSEIRESLIQNIRVEKKRFSWDYMANRFIELYNMIGTRYKGR